MLLEYSICTLIDADLNKLEEYFLDVGNGMGVHSYFSLPRFQHSIL